MENLILVIYILILISVNILSFLLFKKQKINPIFSGIIMMLVSPAVGFLSISLLVYFYDLGGTGEGAAYGGVLLGFITLFNGFIILLIGIIIFILKKFKK